MYNVQLTLYIHIQWVKKYEGDEAWRGIGAFGLSYFRRPNGRVMQAVAITLLTHFFYILFFRLNFIDVATGSLGQGLSVAAGMAYAGKHFDKVELDFGGGNLKTLR